MGRGLTQRADDGNQTRALQGGPPVKSGKVSEFSEEPIIFGAEKYPVAAGKSYDEPNEVEKFVHFKLARMRREWEPGGRPWILGYWDDEIGHSSVFD